jgi:hypothetical protein
MANHRPSLNLPVNLFTNISVVLHTISSIDEKTDWTHILCWTKLFSSCIVSVDKDVTYWMLLIDSTT